MKTLINLVLLTCLSLPLISGEVYELVIVAGQSNAQGWKGDGKAYPKDPVDAEIPLYYVYPEGKKPGEKDNKSEGWEQLGPQKGRFPAGHFGPEIELARLIKKDNGHPLVFKYSKGATGLVGAWGKLGDGKLTDGMLSHLTTALTLMKEQKRAVRIGAFVWIQGESDSQAGDRVKYADYFNAMITALEKTTGQKDFPIILGVDEQHPATAKNTAILDHHKDYAAQHANAEFTSMIGLTKADSTHLTPAALIEHGAVLYKAYRTLNGNAKK